MLEEEGDLKGALEEYNKALSQTKQSYTAARYRRGLTLAKLGNLEAAVQELQEAVRQQPDNAQMHYEFGRVLETRSQDYNHDLESALSHYRIAYNLEPANPQYRADYERLVRKFKR